MKAAEGLSFDQYMDHAKDAQARLNELYRDTIGLIDSLKNRSKKFMNQISDIEDGLTQDDDELDLEENVAALSKDIDEFNRVINKKVLNFLHEIDVIVQNYQAACKVYSGNKGELSRVLNGRKRMLFLRITIRKIRAKVISLQQMNNILFSFSEMLKEVKVEYGKNLSLVNAEVAGSLEACETALKEMDNLH